MSLVEQIIDELEYSGSTCFLRPSQEASFPDAADFSHIFRRAAQRCALRGVYTLRQSENSARDSIVPVVYLCEARSEAEATEIHRLVWNQNCVPFVIIVSPTTVRLCSGFRYEAPRQDVDPVDSGILQAATNLHDALAFLDTFRSRRIDDGTLWEEWGHHVTPDTRVDWKLLGFLNDLDAWLRRNGISEVAVSHALIGKYVYLQYLRHRGILSDRKLAKWDLLPRQVFGRTAQIGAFRRVVDELDNWLNGSVFPLPTSGPNRPKQEHIRKVAGTFAGDDPSSGQLSLGFDAFDFSFIPIETLSVIYEQFLHSPDKETGESRGKSQGAYYTPMTVVNFTLEELDAIHPFADGMKVLDPACGSGAFLVQCYRRIIEQDKEFVPGEPMRPARLRELLERHIFGIDRDSDACRVAELSLSMTLLDYVDPPDLEQTPTFRLPDLHDSNICHGDFFDVDADWRDTLGSAEFDWIVGNPPWIELKTGSVSEDDAHAWRWFQDTENQKTFPTGGKQVAEAFAWQAMDRIASNGCAAFLLPAMTLFKGESRTFRQAFFDRCDVKAVANFSNLAEVLFPGHRYRSGERLTRVSRPRRPAAAFFYGRTDAEDQSKPIPVFSPLVIDQIANRPERSGTRMDTWNIVIDANQIRVLEHRDISTGSSLPWKTAMWGSHLDIRLVNSISKRFPLLRDFVETHGLVSSRGLELRSASSNEPLDPVPEVTGQPIPAISRLPKRELLFEFPQQSVDSVPADHSFVRRGRGDLPLSVCRPPHVIIHKSGRFAVYCDAFVVVPAGQFGIAGPPPHVNLLKALSLYLVSDYSIYHQFLTSPEWGIATSVSTLDTIRGLPVPFGELDQAELSHWSGLHDRIVDASRDTGDQRLLFGERRSASGKLADLLAEMNDAVFDALGLRDDERILVEDLTQHRMELVQGKVSADAVRPAIDRELIEYGETLRAELDSFVEDQPGYRHSVVIARDDKSAIVVVTLEQKPGRPKRTTIRRMDSGLATEADAIRSLAVSRDRQWMYFRRNLRVYDGSQTYVFKPVQHLHWLKSQALLDAGMIIAETLA